jgi:hypothetical protein
MQVAYFEIYPTPALTTTFVLGYVRMEGLTTGFARGLFLLGGSFTANIVAWLLGLFLLWIHVGYRKRLALKMLGFFGVLDLPMYVLFPQIGLQHWVFLGGNTPEPLIGARNMGVADPAFYTIVVTVTLGLLLLYFERLRRRVRKMVVAAIRRLNMLHRKACGKAEPVLSS